MSWAVHESVQVAGRRERARAVRAFVGAVLGPCHPCGDDAVLLVSELFGNSVRHSNSALPGQTITVTVTACARAIRVEVTDRSGPGCPGCVLPPMTQKPAVGSHSWPGWPRGGDGSDGAGGQ
jgi:anti-sigma regulatory factor (Ser/Thr protein kinase)